MTEAHDQLDDDAPRPGKPDYVLLASTVALLLLGTLMVYSASFVVAHNEFNDDAYFLVRQMLWVTIGTVGMLVAMGVDYRRWRTFSLIALLVCVALLILVLVPGVGARSYGATRWLRVGSFFQVQPSEIAKLAIVLYLADWLARRGSTVRQFGHGLLPFAIIVTVVAGLVEIQPDLGTTSIIVGTAACIFFVAGANLLHVGMIGCAAVLAGVAMISRLSGYRMDRISAFLDPFADVQGSGWHTAQGLIALGSGGTFGMGLGASHQKFYWVPNAHTDAIYAIIGEELGFVGCVGVLGLFAVLVWRGLVIAWQAPDMFGRLLATGLTCLIALQSLLNVAVATNSIPYTGIPLPLVSFGGSSTLISMFAIGMLLNVSRYRARQPRDEVEDVAEPAPPPLPGPGRPAFHAPTRHAIRQASTRRARSRRALLSPRRPGNV